MTIQMNVAEAKAKLSELISRAEAGEEVVIARDGKPVVALVPQVKVGKPGARRMGVWDHFGAGLPEDLFIGQDPDTEDAMTLWDSADIAPTR